MTFQNAESLMRCPTLVTRTATPNPVQYPTAKPQLDAREPPGAEQHEAADSHHNQGEIKHRGPDSQSLPAHLLGHNPRQPAG